MPSPFAPLEVVAVVAVVRERNGDSGMRHHEVACWKPLLYRWTWR